MPEGSTANYSVRDEIREFWSERAATFDESVGHEIFSEAERRGWHRLIRKHLGEGRGRDALDLASGTGVISHLMHDAGFRVTGMDWSEPMLAQARAKARTRKADIRFLMGDAERTMESRGSYDIIVNRHLVWTLVDPAAAAVEWFALLKPGGKLLVIDGNMGKTTWVAWLRAALTRITGRSFDQPHMSPEMLARHAAIRSRVHFSDTMPAEAIVALLEAAGFVDVVIDRHLWNIHLAQARKMPFLRALERLAQDRFAICATRPQLQADPVS
ncbi:class I SAM-dependent methyltransferase [Amaricoccus sp.]|uniref:class I SAM-dependent methyltransferase n=1 Tax=Amaricoccus sp. TaxID=1872485 RepID=UPI001B56671D|nr:class I SAM-dependent methyltransferase [Amaricoccus sp.]MBP7002508.1 methyltransferase domain-containing protein [Amaricoccus sp.]